MAGSIKGSRGTPEERFWRKVDKDGPTMGEMTTNCWTWIGAKGQRKYPQIHISGKVIKGSRFSYELAYGPIPEGYHVNHYCSNNSCVRPDHLFASPERNSWATKAKPLAEINGQLHKRCSMCNKLWPYTDEYYHQVGQGRGLRSHCKECSLSINRRKRKIGWDYVLWVNARKSAETRGLEFTITREFINELYKIQGGKCYWFGVPLIPSSESRYPFQPSLDRLRLDGGYTPDNVVLCCYVANFGRNHNTVKQFGEFIKVLSVSLPDALWQKNE